MKLHLQENTGTDIHGVRPDYWPIRECRAPVLEKTQAEVLLQRENKTI